MKGYAIIAGGGKSRRMQLPRSQSKLFLTLNGKPVIFHTLTAFEKAKKINFVWVSMPAKEIDTFRSMLKTFNFSKNISVVEGGKERQDSIYHAMLDIPKDFAEKDTILVHDGARPFIEPQQIDSLVTLARKHGAVVPFSKPKDTVKHLSGSFLGKTLNRDALALVQTPQAFSANLIWQAYQKAYRAKFYATDDSALVEKFFPKQAILALDLGYSNFKITTPEDIAFANNLISNL